MKRTFNYTGRHKIERSQIRIIVRKTTDSWDFDAYFDMGKLKLFPDTALIWLEAYRGNLWMQWPWGSVAAPSIPTVRRLEEFDVPDGVQFRLRVTQPPGLQHNKLLGEADHIKYVKSGEDSDKRQPLLIPVPDELGDRLWKVDFNGDMPTLLINRNAKPSYIDVARKAQFVSLVYPEAMRIILGEALLGEDAWSEDDDEMDSWRSKWVFFAKHLGGPNIVPGLDQCEERQSWIDDVVQLFAKKSNLLQIWNQEIDPHNVDQPE